MWAWISQQSQSLGLIVSFLTLLVWVTYLQLLLMNFLRQRRSAILITRAPGRSAMSHCYVTNMSEQPVYVTSVISTIWTKDGATDLALTDLRALLGNEGGGAGSLRAKGALTTGEQLDLGSFDRLIATMIEASDCSFAVDEVDRFNLTAVAIYASERHPVGAKRGFRFAREAQKDTQIIPESIHTEQLRSRSERRYLSDRCKAHM